VKKSGNCFEGRNHFQRSSTILDYYSSNWKWKVHENYIRATTWPK